MSMRIALLCFMCWCLAGISVLAQVPNAYTTRQADLPCLDKTFGLRIHVNDDVGGNLNPLDTAALEEMVDFANTAFAGICVGFEICEYLQVVNYRYASYAVRDALEQNNLYGDPNRIDVYITARGVFSSNCGRADSAGILRNASSGIMLVAECMDSTTQRLAYELGHYFGLLDTYDSRAGMELVDGSNCATAGDGICDTPADPFIPEPVPPIQWVDRDDPCRFIWSGTDANGQFYVPHTGNIMAPYLDGCACGFTYEQLVRMAGNIRLGGSRVW